VTGPPEGIGKAWPHFARLPAEASAEITIHQDGLPDQALDAKKTLQQPVMDNNMYTLCIRYVVDPNRIVHFRTYVKSELAAIRRSGGKIIGYYLPTDFAGPTNEAYGLIEFQTLASYERYRKALTDDAGHKHNAAELERSGAAMYMTRSILERVGDGEQN
jgi:NIPSNAP